VARVIAAIWIGGFVVSLSILVIGFARLSWVASRCRRIDDGVWAEIRGELSRRAGPARRVALLQSDHPTLLVTWGLARPKIVLPAGADAWSDERARVVLAHEFAHIRRGDWAIQMLAELVRCAYWFNPLLWIACRRLRLESEHACDDAVLAGGMKGSDYADQLLELARILHTSRQPWSPAPAMARPSSLERRISAMLDARINRRPLTRSARALVAVALLAVTLPVAALAQATFSTFSGHVFDPSDAILPATKVVLTNLQTKAKYEVAADRDGRFEFVGLPPGEYSVDVMLPGFATTRAALTVAGQDVRQDFTLQVGSIEESVTVTEGPVEPAVPQTKARRPLPACSAEPRVAGRIGGNIRPPARVRNVNPIYPSNTPGAKPEEIVSLEADISPNGLVEAVHVVGSPHPVFANAAIDAVRQWEFDETLLNCVPIAVAMKVTVRFRSAAQAKPAVRFQLTLPNGIRPAMTSEDGSLATIRTPDFGGFGFRTTIRDRAAGLVNVVLQEGTQANGRVLGEVNARVGDPPVILGTSPAFTISIVSIR
jgi:hypothetical protein